MSKFNPPSNFQFDKPNEWPEWRDRFSRYRLATKLNKDDGEVQVSALIYAMGNGAEHIYKSITFATSRTNPEDANDYDTVLRKFEAYFIPRRNVIHERAKFYQRVQNPGEGVEAFIRNLYELAEHCNFDGNVKYEQIRDKIVIGLSDKELSHRLQMKPELSLDVAIQMARQSELVKSQVSDQLHSDVKQLEEVRQYTARRQTHYRGRRKFTGPVRDTPRECGTCGRIHVPGQEYCPARRAECHKCHKKGHFAQVCRTKSVREVTENSDHPTYFLGSNSCDDSEPAWRETVAIQGGLVNFKLDSGADVIIIAEATLNQMKPKPKLKPVYIRLTSPGGQLACLGQFVVSLNRLSVGCGTTPRRQSGDICRLLFGIRVIYKMLPPHGHCRNIFFINNCKFVFLFILG